MRHDCADWIHLAQGARNRWRAGESGVIGRLVPQKTRSFCLNERSSHIFKFSTHLFRMQRLYLFSVSVMYVFCTVKLVSISRQSMVRRVVDKMALRLFPVKLPRIIPPMLHIHVYSHIIKIMRSRYL